MSIKPIGILGGYCTKCDGDYEGCVLCHGTGRIPTEKELIELRMLGSSVRAARDYMRARKALKAFQIASGAFGESQNSGDALLINQTEQAMTMAMLCLGYALGDDQAIGMVKNEGLVDQVESLLGA